jgi:hypothetical protein
MIFVTNSFGIQVCVERAIQAGPWHRALEERTGSFSAVRNPTVVNSPKQATAQNLIARAGSA